MKLSSLTMVICDLDVASCGLIIGLQSMCEVTGTYMCIAILDLDWGHDLSLIRFSVK